LQPSAASRRMPPRVRCLRRLTPSPPHRLPHRLHKSAFFTSMRITRARPSRGRRQRLRRVPQHPSLMRPRPETRTPRPKTRHEMTPARRWPRRWLVGVTADEGFHESCSSWGWAPLSFSCSSSPRVRCPKQMVACDSWPTLSGGWSCRRGEAMGRPRLCHPIHLGCPALLEV